MTDRVQQNLKTSDESKPVHHERSHMGGSASAVDVTATDGKIPNLPHPLECFPSRPYQMPKYTPRPREFCGLSRTRAEGWRSPTMHLAPDREAVRINFTYRNGGTSTAACFSAKARCNQYTEGPHERRYLRFLETDYRCIDFQFQFARIEWQTVAGLKRSYTVDGARQTDDGHITFFEIKACQAYFDEPETADRLELVEGELARHGFSFDRIVGRQLINGVREKLVDDVFLDRLTRFSSDDVCRAVDLIETAGGCCSLGRLHEILHANRCRAKAMANAMLVRRIVGFSLERPPSPDTLVYIPQQLPLQACPLRKLKI